MGEKHSLEQLVDNYLKKGCNLFIYGQCNTLHCLKRYGEFVGCQDYQLVTKIEEMRATLAAMFESEPDKPTNWRYNRNECAEMAQKKLEQLYGKTEKHT
jgi:hypothetical protein